MARQPTVPASPDHRQRVVRTVIQAATILTAGLWIYWPSLHGAWLWDDFDLITHNENLRHLAGLWNPWSAHPISNYWPLTWSLFWAEKFLWGNEPTGFHAVSLGLHLASAFLFWRLLSRLGLRWAWLGGLLFAIHPLAVESAAWVTETKNTLSLPFFLLSATAYLDFDRNDRGPTYLFSVLCYLLAMLSKTSVAMLPGVLLLYCWWRRGRVSQKDLFHLLPYFAIAAVLGVFTAHFEAAHAAPDPLIDSETLAGRMGNAALAAWFYLGKVIWPGGLLPVYPRWSIQDSWPLALLAGAFLLAVLGMAWTRRRDWGRPVLLGLGFFLLTILPVLGFVRMDYQTISPVADHFVYLPMLGLIGLAVAGMESLGHPATGGRRRLIAGATTALCVLLAAASRAQARHWHDPETLWSYTLGHEPDCWLAHCALGVALQDIPGREAEALHHYEEAVRLKPDFIEARNNLGAVLARVPGRANEAIGQLTEALRLKPDFALAHFNLGCVLNQIPGRESEAIAQYQETLRLRPDLFAAHFNLAAAEAKQPGRSDAAIREYEQAIRLDPTHAAARSALGKILVARPDRLAEATRQFQEVVRLQPDDAEARFDLAYALGRQPGQRDEAIGQYRAALRLDPGFAEASSNLGLALCERGEIKEGLACLDAAIRLKPGFVPAHLARAKILLETGQGDAAITELEQAARLEPEDGDVQRALTGLRASVRRSASPAN